MFFLAQMWNDNEWLNLVTICMMPFQIVGLGISNIYGFMQLFLIVAFCVGVLRLAILRFRQKKIRYFHFIGILFAYPVSVFLTNFLCSQFLWTDLLHVAR